MCIQRNDPKVALLLPYGAEMTRFSAIANVTRGEDGVLRDIPLRETVGDWALPSLPLRLATTVTARSPRDFAAVVRPDWRRDTRLPRISAADLLAGHVPVCSDATTAPPALQDRVVLVGYTASGLNDAKPTPVDPVMPGVEVMAEATEALIAGSAIRTPPAWLKYAIAMLFTSLTTFAFFRGEPATDIDSVFVATNVTMLTAAFVGLTFFGFFFDIFASVGFIGLVFGLCRLYAGIQRGRAVGNGDFLPEFDPAQDRWLAIARLRFVPDAGLGEKAACATPAGIPPTTATVPVCRQRCGHARRCRGTQKLAARGPRRPDGPGMARRKQRRGVHCGSARSRQARAAARRIRRGLAR